MSLTVLLIVIFAGTAFAYIDTHYLWSQRFYPVYEGYNTIHKNHVRSVQRIIRHYPKLPLLVVDGIFGNDTTNGVEAFQRKRNIDVDGRVGPDTWYQFQQRIWFSHTAGGNDYYKVNTSESDTGAATGTTYFRHDANGAWKYNNGGNWETIR